MQPDAVLGQVDDIDFGRDVRPLLADRCFLCHGPDESSRQAEMRLDVRETAVELDVIVPGNSAKSELVRRILSGDADDVMPPPESHKRLTVAEKRLLIRWIDEGAEYKPHWAFIPPQKSMPRATVGAHSKWVRHEIDRFVLARLDRWQWAPSVEADRSTLIRRLFLDLTGLPPTSDQVEAFVAKNASDAYEKLVDQLLKSPHYGERMALTWLDAARYADTNGYSIDGGRDQWLWRDWVIHAFNQNMPYDQFLVEQLAGDLLPEATTAQITATGFQRNNMVTHEGGTLPEENLVNYNADRVKTLGEAVLGLTLGCAQCHDHKYDPLTQREYYQLFAYFNTASDRGLDGDGGQNPTPVIQARTVLPTDELNVLDRQIAELEQQLTTPNAELLHDWECQQRAELAQRGVGLELHPLELMGVTTPNAGAGFQIVDGRYVRISTGPGIVAYDILARLPELEQPIRGLRVVFSTDPDKPDAGLGHGTLPRHDGDGAAGLSNEPTEQASQQNTFVLTAVTVSADLAPAHQVNLHRVLPITRVTASDWHPAYRADGILDPRNESGWAPFHLASPQVYLTCTFHQPLEVGERNYLTVQLNFGHGHSLVARRVELAVLTGNDDGSSLPPEVITILQTPSQQRTATQQDALRSYFAHYAELMRSVRIDLANLQERQRVLREPFSAMVMDVADQPRQTYLLHRGDYAQPRDRVTGATPAFLPPMSSAAPANRLGLAEWLVRPDHPLTARVVVNRVWQQLFGRGLVSTAADFGLQGQYPSHPELLDWLAVDLVESGWDIKRLVRGIVCSATYRQSSDTTPEMLARDAENTWLARGARFRLPAEVIRDSALQTSDLLVRRIGGPSVHPYAPGDLWREVSHYASTPATAQTFVQDHGEKLYRRSLYTYWKRTAPPPNLAVFDSPNREVCVVTRTPTTTPLQALVLLNDVQFVEAARGFAQRIVTHAASDEARLRWAFRELVAREPCAAELEILGRGLRRERQRYQRDPASAASLLANGESPRDQSIPAEEHAAWTQIAAILLNQSETITRN